MDNSLLPLCVYGQRWTVLPTRCLAGRTRGVPYPPRDMQRTIAFGHAVALLQVLLHDYGCTTFHRLIHPSSTYRFTYYGYVVMQFRG